MPRADLYPIIDEPVPSKWTHLAVSPVFPMFGFMLGGAFIAWLWFGLNAYAFGSASRRKEALVAAFAPLVSAAIFVGLVQLANRQVLSESSLPYAALSIVLFKLATMYWLFHTQHRSFALYTYFGGRQRSGFIVLAAAFMFGRDLLRNLPGWAQVILQ